VFEIPLPIWFLISFLVFLPQPQLLDWFGSREIVWSLSGIMVWMGLTMKREEIQKILEDPKPILLGFGLQYTIMPFLGWLIAEILDLPIEAKIGVYLVAVSPGGTASNVIAFLARANTTLSVCMTSVSTFASVLITPFYIYILLHQNIKLDSFKMIQDIGLIILLPVGVGFFIKSKFPKVSNKLEPFASPVSSLLISLIVTSIVSKSIQIGAPSFSHHILPVLLLHTLGFGLGYFISKLFGSLEIESRTISIEVGMQNSGLASVLAKTHFSSYLLAPLPCAFSSVIHSILGSMLAFVWRRSRPKGIDKNQESGLMTEL
jgi:BASS family bile acid:Na+ symporter